MPSFNLVDDPWIPVVLVASGETTQLGLRQTLTRAHEVRELFDSSPLVTVALHRLLLAVLHRCFGPRTMQDWQSLWARGRWDASALDAYFDRWRDRFDLFDLERPYYQTTNLDDARMQPAALLALEAATGNNATLFDHHVHGAGVTLAPARAAAYLIARQAFSIGFGKSEPFYFQDSPLVRGFAVLALGTNLFETLALNLIVYNEETPIPIQGTDVPAWEREADEPPRKEGTPVRGYLDYLTWQSRRIHLISASGSDAIVGCQVLQNHRLPLSPPLDPFKAYRVSKEQGYVPRGLNAERALWRDSHALFQETDDSGRRPEVFQHLARIERLRRAGRVEAQPAYGFAAYGFATDPGKAASVTLWRQERLPLPLAYLTDANLREALQVALRLAEDVDRDLGHSAWVLSRLLLAPASDKPEARKPDRGDVDRLISGLGLGRRYWSRLESLFKQLMVDLPADQEGEEADGTVVYGATLLGEWARRLQRTARAVFADVAADMDTSARALKATAAAEIALAGRLHTTLGEYLVQASASIVEGGRD